MTGLDDILQSAPPAKRAILIGALDLFASRGVEAVSVRDIASVSGFTNPALFRHFSSKHDLAQSLFDACYRELVEALERVDTEDGLAAWLTAVLREIARSPRSVHFVVENVRHYWHGLPADLRARNLPGQVRIRLEREQRAGRLRADLDVALARTIVDGTLAQIARSAHFSGTEIDPATLGQNLANLLTRGFGP